MSKTEAATKPELAGYVEKRPAGGGYGVRLLDGSWMPLQELAHVTRDFGFLREHDAGRSMWVHRGFGGYRFYQMGGPRAKD